MQYWPPFRLTSTRKHPPLSLPLHPPVPLLDGLLVVVLPAKALEVGRVQIPTPLGPGPDVVDDGGWGTADHAARVSPEVSGPGRPPPTGAIERRPLRIPGHVPVPVRRP